MNLRKCARFAFAAAVCGPIALSPAVTRAGNYYDGSDYLALIDSERNLFVMALWDMFSHMSDQVRDFVDDATLAHISRLEACVNPMYSEDLRAKFDAYYNAHADATGYAVAGSFEAALMERCP